ncbi:MAG: hypothetical protein ACYCPQ_01675 [Elusimicrobiota bacterium]
MTRCGGGFSLPDARPASKPWIELCVSAIHGSLAALCLAPNRDFLCDEALRDIALKALAEAEIVVTRGGGMARKNQAVRMMDALCRKSPENQGGDLKKAAGPGSPLSSLLAIARQTKTPVPLLSGFQRILARLKRFS